MLLKISFSLILSLGLLFSQLSHSQVPLSQETKPDHDLQTYNQSPTLFDHEIGNDEIVRYTDQTRPFVHYFKDLASDTDCIANNTTFNLIAEAIKFKVNTLLVYNILRIELEMETFSESKPQGIIENSVEMIKKLNAAAIVSHNSQL